MNSHRRRVHFVPRPASSALPTYLCLSLLLGISSALTLEAQPVLPVGDDFQVNTFTTGTQQWTAVSIDEPRAFLVLWMTSDSDVKPANFVMRGRRFADGAPVGGEVEINSFTGDASHAHAAVDVEASGNFVITWDSNGVTGTDDSVYGIQARRFQSDGTTPIGDQFQVNTFTPSNQRRTDIAAISSTGTFVVVWQSFGSPEDDTTVAVIARRFDSMGAPLGDDFQVNTYTTSTQLYPHVTARPTGEFLVVWESGRFATGPDGDGAAIRGQRFGVLGQRVGVEFAINTETVGQQQWPQAVHTENGDFMVAWHSAAGDGDGASIRRRRFSSTGAPQEGEMQVNTSTLGDQTYSNLAITDDNGFVVVWQSEDQPGDFEIRGRRFRDDGSPWGDDFQINTYTTGSQIRPAVDISGSEMVVVWESYGSPGSDDADRSVQMRRFQLPLFADGFESGDTDVWSASTGVVP